MKPIPFKKIIMAALILLLTAAFMCTADRACAADKETNAAPNEGPGNEFPPPPDAGPGGPGAPPPPPHGGPDDGTRPPKSDFMKHLTSTQREEAQCVMLIIKNRHDLADAYSELGKTDEAVAEINKLLAMKLPSYFPLKEFDERKSMLAMKIVDYYLKAGKEDQAAAVTDDIIKKGNLKGRQLAQIYMILSQLHRKNGNRERTVEFLKRSLEVLEKK